MNLLVTGGAGYIGSGLLVKLGEKFPDATITSLDNLTTGDYHYVEHLKEDDRYDLLVGDVRKKSDLKKAIVSDTSGIIHLAAMPGLKICNDQPKNAINTNIYGTHLLLEEAVNQDVERFIFASSAAVYGTPQEQPISEKHPVKPVNLYGVTKASGEQLVNACYITHGLNTTILRLSNVYGLSAYTKWKTVIAKFVWQAVHDRPLTVRADGKQQRNFVHVKDVIDAIIRCLGSSKKAVVGETFNIGGQALSVNQIANTVIQEGRRRLEKEVLKVYTPLEAGEVYTSDFSYDLKSACQKMGYGQKREVSLGVSELFDYALEVKATGGRQE